MATSSKSPFSSSSLSLPFKTAYGSHPRVQLVKTERSGKTKQSFKDECDINFILSRYRRTRVLDWVTQYNPRYGDATGYDFQKALDTVVAGREAFAALPSNIRSRFGNDPAQFLDFVHDPDNEQEMRKMGLLSPKDATASETATPVAPPPPRAMRSGALMKPQGHPRRGQSPRRMARRRIGRRQPPKGTMHILDVNGPNDTE